MSLGLKTILITWLFLVTGAMAALAQNLVINGGFENGNICQEFQLPCGPAAWVTLPVKTKVVFYGTDTKKETNHHFGLVLENIKNPYNGRSYVQTMLCRPLVAGQRYHLTMRCRTGPAPFEKIGVLLADDEIIDGIDTLDTLTPTFEITTGSEPDKSDVKKWVTVQHTFIARGGEQFLLLGNLSKDYSPRKPEYAHDALGNIVLSIDDVALVPEQPPLPDIDTACIGLERSLYGRHVRHTRYVYLLGEARKTPATAMVHASPAPRDTEAAIPKVYDTLLSVPFDVNSSLLDAGYTRALDSVLQKVLSGPFKNIIIIGHTDNTGPAMLNKALSVHRAQTVATYFIAKGKIPAGKISVSGKADAEPVAPNNTQEGRQENRRVVIIVKR